MLIIELWRDSAGLYTVAYPEEGSRPMGNKSEREDDLLAWVITGDEDWGERTLRRAVEGELIAIEPADGPHPWIGHTIDGERVYCGDELVASLLNTNVEELWDSAHEGCPGPYRRGLMAVSIGHRLHAGVQSFSRFRCEFTVLIPPSADGDRMRVRVCLSAPLEGSDNARATFKGDLVLDATGGRAEWRVDDTAMINAGAKISWGRLPLPWQEGLTARLVSEFAAYCARLGTR